MPKLTLTYNLPEEKDEFTLANKGHDFYSALWDISNELRTWRKGYKKPTKVLEAISDLIADIDLECVS